MAILFSFNMVTLDGFFEGPNREIDWHNVDEEFNEFAVEQTGSVDTLLFGRVTFQLMASYWPTDAAIKDDPVVAGLMNRLSKVVVSRTLQKAEWNKTRLIKSDVEAEIRKLKKESSKGIALFGSANLMSTLMQADLIDEYRIMVNPVVLGSGRPLFKEIKKPTHLKLVRTRAFRSGNVLLCYQPERT